VSGVLVLKEKNLLFSHYWADFSVLYPPPWVPAESAGICHSDGFQRNLSGICWSPLESAFTGCPQINDKR
jgi:hypothetical protein